MTQKFILMGGPGSGKSSIIMGLEQQGEYVIREAAEDVIRYHQALGKTEPWKHPDFQDWILALQLQREKNIPTGIERVFIDSGVHTGLAYYELQERVPSSKIQEAVAQAQYENPVFLVKSLGQCVTNAVRREDLAEALRIEELHKINYLSFGYSLVEIKPNPLKTRIRDVLNKALLL
ncbi:MAG: AAA family ATPase [Candidatus Woesearchaeota archaeon]